MLMLEKRNHCCGVAEMCNLSSHDTPEDAMLGVLTAHRAYAERHGGACRYAFLMFSEVSRWTGRAQNNPIGYKRGYGLKLYRFIKKHNLGRVIGTHSTLNQNSGRKIRVYLWAPDMPAIEAWAAGWAAKHPVENPPQPVCGL